MKRTPVTKGIGVVTILALAVLAMGCASSAQFRIKKAAETNMLEGHKTVVLSFAMAERVLPKSVASSSLLTRAATLARWRSQTKDFEEELQVIQAAKLDELQSFVAEAYGSTYHAETAAAKYDFGSGAVKVNYFSNIKQPQKDQIVKVCQDNDADFAVTFIGQIIHSQISGINLNSITRVESEMCVFDRNGNLVVQGTIGLPIHGAKDFGYQVASNNPAQYENLFEEIKKIMVDTEIQTRNGKTVQIPGIIPNLVKH